MILLNFVKVFEMSLYTCIYKNIRPYISSSQTDFLTKHSTMSNLSEFTQIDSNHLDNRNQVDRVYTDFSRAFDGVNHKILLHKLETYGVGKHLVDLTESCLYQRQLFVSYNSFKSSTFYEMSLLGYLRVYNLGPHIFSLFVNDLCLSLQCHSIFFLRTT